MEKLVCYVNGEFVPAEKAALPLNDLGIVRGYGVFDVLNTYHRKPFHMRDHILRLERSAASIRLDLPWTVEEIEQIIGELLNRNFDANPDLGDVAIRVIATGGPSENLFTPQQRPSLAILISPFTPPDEVLYMEGAYLISVEMQRFMAEVKSLNYIDAIMASQVAADEGAIETLYRTPDGRITECTRCSFFLVKDRQLLTADSEVLDGITRNVVCALAQGHFELASTELYYDSLIAMDEAFIVGTGKEVLPIVRIDDVTIGSGRPGPVTKQLMSLYQEYVAQFVENDVN
ncbi:MAG: aminotransferase class IV [Chloroflexota bacterium]